MTRGGVHQCTITQTFFFWLPSPPSRDQHQVFLVTALPPGDVRLGDPQHVDGSLVQLDEHAVEDLAQTEQLQNLADFRADTVDTAEQNEDDG